MISSDHLDDKDLENEQLSEETLLAYLEGRLSGADLRAVEALLASEGMDSDALEGLQNYSATEAKEVRLNLNAQLHQSLKKKKRRTRRGLLEQRWSWMAICILLLLAIAGFAVIWIIHQAAQ